MPIERAPEQAAELRPIAEHDSESHDDLNWRDSQSSRSSRSSSRDRKSPTSLKGGSRIANTPETLPDTQLRPDMDPSEATMLTTYLVVPPDGGWGWVVVGASFMLNMIVDGIIYSFGVFMKPIEDEFQVGKAQVALLGSLLTGLYLMAGPFVSALANRYGFRSVTIAGAIVAAAGFGLSAAANSVEFLCFTYGVLGGVGFGLVYVPSILTIGFYFERWRALATGLACCGSGIGTFILAPLSLNLVASYGWRSTMLVHAGLVLLCVVFGALFRPLHPVRVELPYDPDKAAALDPDAHETAGDAHVQASVSGSAPASAAEDKRTLLVRMKRTKDQHLAARNAELSGGSNASYPTATELLGSSSKVVRRSCLSLDMTMGQTTPERPPTPFPDDEMAARASRPLYRDDIFFGASLSSLPVYRQKLSALDYTMSVTRLPMRDDVVGAASGAPRCGVCPCLPQPSVVPAAVKRALATLLDVSLLRSPPFLILAMNGFFCMMGFFVPFTYLKDRAVTSGWTEDTAVWLVSSIGITNTFARIVFGAVASVPGVNAITVVNVALTLGGIGTICSGLLLDEWFQFTYTVVFGIAIACFATLRSVVAVQLLGLEKLTNAFGLLLLFQGVAACMGTPIAGAFKDATGGYDHTFYLAGGLILFSALLCYPLNYINAWEKGRKKEKKTVRLP